MAALTITKTLGDVKTLFNKIKEVYYFATPDQAPSALTAADMELPVISENVTFNTGEADITKVKLTTGETWTSMATAGDSDISLQIASFDEKVNEIFLNKIGSKVTMGASVEGYNYEGYGYDLEPKKVSCGLLFCSEDKEVLIYIPNVEIYSSAVIEDGKPGYFNLKCTPLASTSGETIYFLKKGSASM